MAHYPMTTGRPLGPRTAADVRISQHQVVGAGVLSVQDTKAF